MQHTHTPEFRQNHKTIQALTGTDPHLEWNGPGTHAEPDLTVPFQLPAVFSFAEARHTGWNPWRPGSRLGWATVPGRQRRWQTWPGATESQLDTGWRSVWAS